MTKREDVDAKLVFLAHSMRAKLLTTDYNLAKMAEFHGVSWLNLNALAKSLRPELMLGERLEVDLVKPELVKNTTVARISQLTRLQFPGLSGLPN